ncbi:MAG: hypothetical protein H6557_12980 [Lewinellaceae bacterium]|nr:hypothetical protein [Phaeodactylibacter sp.]MCB9037523.1 hypothetical protein [Lewinellaceae bacterium]MCB9054207.1 hypothetical protein [Lewinellaceae bacterium]
MRITASVLVVFLMGSVLSCSQESQEFKIEDGKPLEEEYEPAEDYLQLQVGNYWVFESFSIDLQTGAEAPLHKRDSVYVLKDTLIGRSDYFVLEGSRLGQAYRAVLRCSGPEVMDSEGRLLFSTAAIGDTTGLPADWLANSAESGDICLHSVQGVEVPYGTFDALEYRHTFYFFSSEELRDGGTVRHRSDFFAKGVGLIQYTNFLPNQPLDIEMRLVRCKVQ